MSENVSEVLGKIDITVLKSEKKNCTMSLFFLLFLHVQINIYAFNHLLPRIDKPDKSHAARLVFIEHVDTSAMTNTV